MGKTQRRIIAVGGGKGGVGKSLVAANLSVAFADMGLKTVLIDADFGAANQHTLFGINHVGPSIHSLITKEVDTLDELLVPLGTRLQLVPGCNAIPGSANIGHAQKKKLIRRIEALEADVVVIDVGAGIAYNVVDLYTLADLRMTVLLPQLTSFQNAYAFLKAAVHRELRDAARIAGQTELFDEVGPTYETERMDALLDRIAEGSPRVARMARCRLENFGAYLMGNQVISPKDRGTLAAVKRMFTDFLGIEPQVLGYLRYNRLVADSVNDRVPLLRKHPDDDCAKAIVRAAEALLKADVEQIRKDRVAQDSSEVRTYRPEDEVLLDEIQALLSA